MTALYALPGFLEFRHQKTPGPLALYAYNLLLAVGMTASPSGDVCRDGAEIFVHTNALLLATIPHKSSLVINPVIVGPVFEVLAQTYQNASPGQGHDQASALKSGLNDIQFMVDALLFTGKLQSTSGTSSALRFWAGVAENLNVIGTASQPVWERFLLDLHPATENTTHREVSAPSPRKVTNVKAFNP